MRSLLFLGVVATLLAACETAPVTGRSQMMLVGEGEERQMGLQAYRDVLSKEQLSDDTQTNALVEKVEAAVGTMGRIKVAYVHAAAQEEAEKIKFLIEARLTVVESLVAELSPALGVHTGPGTAGLCYYPVDS